MIEILKEKQDDCKLVVTKKEGDAKPLSTIPLDHRIEVAMKRQQDALIWKMKTNQKYHKVIKEIADSDKEVRDARAEVRELEAELAGN